MKKLSYLLIIFGCLLVLPYCKKELTKSELFKLLTTPTWTSDSLLANGDDASGPGQLLEDFEGDAKFYENGTGYFGDYTGSWWFDNGETQIVINPDADTIPFNITCNIVELTALSLKITAAVPDQNLVINQIRMTFKAK
jgi:hypothetical protein